MPLRDGTGPRGAGARTGRGMGSCAVTKKKKTKKKKTKKKKKKKK